MYFKFSRHVTGPFADPFVEHLTIFVFNNTGFICHLLSLLSLFLGPCHLWLSFHHALPCLHVKRLLRRRSHWEVAVSHRAQPPLAQCWKVDFWQPSNCCQEFRVWAVPVSDHRKGDKEVLINVVQAMFQLRTTAPFKPLEANTRHGGKTTGKKGDPFKH